MTVSCRDTDQIVKVDGAGTVVERDGQELQVMHNGLLIERGCYYGPWMDEIISALGGHHEPQEELVFQRIVERLRASGGGKTMVEFGSFWAYYSMWFAREFPGARIVDLEPDPAYLDVGRRNAALNGLSEAIVFGSGAVGDSPGSVLQFVAESNGLTYEVPQYDLASTMREFNLDQIDLLMVDIQGAEQILLPRARDLFASGRVRFLVVSTHHHLISGNPTTHQEALRLLGDAGAQVIAEHSVAESYSGDGLIAVSFDPRDAGFTVEVSHARAKESLFGEVEPDLAVAWRQLADMRRELAAVQGELAHVRHELGNEREALRASEAGLARVHQTKLWRWSRIPRAAYARARDLGRQRQPQ